MKALVWLLALWAVTLGAQEGMGIPSTGETRGQKDAVGFATTAEAMALAWKLSEAPPPPEKLGEIPSSGIVGVVCPHDDYVYAGRMYRLLVPLVKAPRVVVVGVLHPWKRLGLGERVVFDPFKAWRTPDGPVPVSSLRETLLARLPAEEVLVSREASEAEHSVEAIVYWLRHQNPNLEILPIFVPGMGFPRLAELARKTGRALREVMVERGWQPGRDVAVVVSADAVHYGPDFHHTPFGEGGVEAYVKACARDKELLLGPLAGPVGEEKLLQAFTTWVDPQDVGTYRLPWCGRFSIPFGYLMAQEAFGGVVAHPVAYATSVGWPELPAAGSGLGRTAPANLYHFVGYPGVVLTLSDSKPLRFLGPPEKQRRTP
ncbi:MAG: AmmeMemoRadiSam system protein B [Acidobacteriota bacterium]